VIKPLFQNAFFTYYSPRSSLFRQAFLLSLFLLAGNAVQRAPYEYQTDPAVPRFSDDRPVVVFDGKCILCSSFAQFLLKKDRDGRFRLLAAQSELGSALYRHFDLDPVDYETYVLLQDGKAYFRSEATLRILAGLGMPWRLLATLRRLVPLALSDAVYGVIARNRLRWFGVRAQCYLPDPSRADRFLL
jgi:predicted DCC family thiol-disulfide oxidoreductase YuxK